MSEPEDIFDPERANDELEALGNALAIWQERSEHPIGTIVLPSCLGQHALYLAHSYLVPVTIDPDLPDEQMVVAAKPAVDQLRRNGVIPLFVPESRSEAAPVPRSRFTLHGRWPPG